MSVLALIIASLSGAGSVWAAYTAYSSRLKSIKAIVFEQQLEAAQKLVPHLYELHAAMARMARFTSHWIATLEQHSELRAAWMVVPPTSTLGMPNASPNLREVEIDWVSKSRSGELQAGVSEHDKPELDHLKLIAATISDLTDLVASVVDSVGSYDREAHCAAVVLPRDQMRLVLGVGASTLRALRITSRFMGERQIIDPDELYTCVSSIKEAIDSLLDFIRSHAEVEQLTRQIKTDLLSSPGREPQLLTQSDYWRDLRDEVKQTLSDAGGSR